MNPLKALKDLIIGAVIGVTSMLPGISGATMAVAFGIYERLIRDLADLRTYLRKDFVFIMLLAIGLAAGTVICAKVLDGVLESYPVEALMFFTGLIVAQLIPLYADVRSEAESAGYGKNEMASFAFGILIMVFMLILTVIGGRGDVTVEHDALGIIIMFMIGIVVAVSALLPGLSHSTILLVCGLMTAFLEVIEDLDFVLLAPMALGAVAAVLTFSKIIEKALTDHHLTTLLFILGLTVGSIMVIIYNAGVETNTLIDVIGGIVCAMAGFGLSMLCTKYGIREE